MNEIFFALIVLVNPVNLDEVRYLEPVYFYTQTDCHEGLNQGMQIVADLPKYDGYIVQGQCTKFTLGGI